MSEWFTVEQIDDDTYVISEYGHYEETHCYLLNGTGRSLLIDTGLGVANIKEVVDSLATQPLLAATTHVHWDHIGGHKYFEKIAVHEAEAAWLISKFPIPLEMVKNSLTKVPCNFPPSFDLEAYEVYQGKPAMLLQDNDIIDLGDRAAKVLHTPGHSPGHICFYEESRGYLYAGDLIYMGTLDAFYPTTNPLDFMNSVDKLRGLKVTRLLPGHHSLSLSNGLIEEIYQGFAGIQKAGRLKQGNGMFYFPAFNIHI